MQMTQALHELVRAHHDDGVFPYMDFVGAFLLMEGWVRRAGGRARDMLLEASPEDLLGLPLGVDGDDLKLGYVLELLRDHGIELLEAPTASCSASLCH